MERSLPYDETQSAMSLSETVSFVVGGLFHTKMVLGVGRLPSPEKKEAGHSSESGGISLQLKLGILKNEKLLSIGYKRSIQVSREMLTL